MAQGRTVRGLAGLAAAAAILAGSAAHSAADPAAWVARVNDIYRGRDRALPDEQRTEKILFPALAAMDAPPASLATTLRAALLAPGDALWSEADAWAQSANQQAALEALRKAAGSEKITSLLLPYGSDAVPQEWRDAGLDVDLGTPPLLAAARFNYLRAMDSLAALVHVEATRLGADKKGRDALNLLADLTLIARQMADREFAAEMRWGVHHMARGLERIRDVAWVYRASLNDQDLKNLIDRLSDANLRVDRVKLPRADRIAAEQALELAYVARQGPNPDTFGATMARLSAKDRPLTLFGESARWQSIAGTQGGTFDAADAVADVSGGWEYRWNLRPFDPALAAPSDYERLDKSKFAMVEAILGPIDGFFAARHALRAELAATRAGLAALAFERRNRTFPSELSLTRPTYVRDIERDPWSKDGNAFVFFVPIRDQPRGERELPKPHVIGVALAAAPSTPVDPAALEEYRKVLAATRNARLDAIIAAGQIKIETGEAQFEGLVSGKYLANATAEQRETMDRLFADARNRGVNAVAAYRDGLEAIQAPIRARLKAAKNSYERDQIIREIAGEARKLSESILKMGDDAVIAAFERAVGSFSASLDDSYFILYSSGTDQVAEWAQSVGEGGSDVLYWPPVLTLLRQDLDSRGLDPTALTAAWADYTPRMAAPAAKQVAEDSPQRSAPSSGPTRRRVD